MKKISIFLATMLSFSALADTPFKTFVTGQSAAATNDGTELVPEIQGGNTVKATAAAVGNSGTLTGDCTKATAATAVTCTKTNGVAFAASATTDTTNATNLASGTVAAARGGAGTVTGALKGNGSGVVSQAACADLSNASASCSTDATNATNISSGTLSSARLPTNGANPTAVVGSAAVNGSATTWMRSDAAPAIDLTFTPTWTGVHTWSLTEPRIILIQSGAAADFGHWDLDVAAGVFCLRTRTDADAAGQSVMCATRSSTTTYNNITFGANTGNPTYSFLGSGAASFGGPVTNSAAEPRFIMNESDQGTDLKRWDLDVQAGVLTGRTRTDADGAGKNWLSVTRGTTTAVSNISLGNATDNPTGTWLGTGTVTFGGAVASSNFVQGLRLLPSGSSISSCNTCLYLPAASTMGFAANNVQAGTWTSTQLTVNTGLSSAGTKFTASGCSNSATVGGAVAGQFTSGTTGTCTVVITLPAATNGWACHADDLTTPANFIGQSASSTTSCTVQGTTVSGDVLVFSAMGF